nr:response regulator [Streptomyces sp. HNM0575]
MIDTLPSLLWVAFATVVYLSLRGTIVQSLVPRVTALRTLGVEIEIAGRLIDQVAEESDITVTSAARRGVLGRLEHAADTLSGGKILWVDDHPEKNGALIRLFRSMEMRVDTVHSTNEAKLALGHGSYDLIISDIDRHGDPQAGISMLRELESMVIGLPVLIHSVNFNPELGVDHRIFAATTKPVEIVHYVIDLMERARFGAPQV